MIRHLNRQGAIAQVLTGLAPYLDSSLLFGIAGGTAYLILTSNGKRSLGWINLFALFLGFVEGMIDNTKTTLFQPYVTYFLTCLCFRFQFRKVHYVSSILVTLFAIFVVAPYANYSRTFITAKDLRGKIEQFQLFAEKNLSSPELAFSLFKKKSLMDTGASIQKLYFGRPMGLLDRVCLLNASDRLIEVVNTRGPAGFDVFTKSFTLLPHLIGGGGATINKKNVLGHTAEMIAPKDVETGIDFSILIEPFGEGSWLGLLLILFPVLVIFFTVDRSGIGTVRGNIWAIGFAVVSQHLFGDEGPGDVLALLIRWLPAVIVLRLLILRVIVPFFSQRLRFMQTRTEP